MPSNGRADEKKLSELYHLEEVKVVQGKHAIPPHSRVWKGAWECTCRAKVCEPYSQKGPGPLV